MYIKKKLVIILVTILIMFTCIFLNVTVSVKIVTPLENIKSFVTSDVIKEEDYQKEMCRIERMLYYKFEPRPKSRELYTYIVIESKDGHKEIITHNDDQMIHTLDGKVLETYKIPFFTTIYSKNIFWTNGDVKDKRIKITETQG